MFWNGTTFWRWQLINWFHKNNRKLIPQKLKSFLCSDITHVYLHQTDVSVVVFLTKYFCVDSKKFKESQVSLFSVETFGSTAPINFLFVLLQPWLFVASSINLLCPFLQNVPLIIFVKILVQDIPGYSAVPKACTWRKVAMLEINVTSGQLWHQTTNSCFDFRANWFLLEYSLLWNDLIPKLFCFRVICPVKLVFVWISV